MDGPDGSVRYTPTKKQNTLFFVMFLQQVLPKQSTLFHQLTIFCISRKRSLENVKELEVPGSKNFGKLLKHPLTLKTANILLEK